MSRSSCIDDREINAFVAGGQIVYLHSGLFTAAENANEVQGVIAHELGHITGGHVLRMQRGRPAGDRDHDPVAAARRGGDRGRRAARPAWASIAAGQQAAMGRFLAFTRVQENSADQAGATFLSRAGISGRGSLAFFRRLQNLEFRMTHPAGGQLRAHPPAERRAHRRAREALPGDPAWDRPTDPALEERFQRVRAKLVRLCRRSAPGAASAIRESNQIDPGPLCPRLCLSPHRAIPTRRNAEADALLASAAARSLFPRAARARSCSKSGHPQEALAALREAVASVPNQPLIAALLGHALISTEDPANFEEAKRVLRLAVGRDNDNPFAWYQLGIVYDREGDQARAALATAERYNLEGQPSSLCPMPSRR